MFYRFWGQVFALLFALTAFAHAHPSKPLVVWIDYDVTLDTPESEEADARLERKLQKFEENLSYVAMRNYDRFEIQYDKIENPLLGTVLIVYGLREDESKEQLVDLFEKNDFKILDESYAGAAGTLFFDMDMYDFIVRKHFENEGVAEYLKIDKEDPRVVDDEHVTDEDPARAASIERATDAAWEEIFEPLTKEIRGKLDAAGLTHLLYGKGLLYQGPANIFVQNDSLLQGRPSNMSDFYGRTRLAEQLIIVVKDRAAQFAVSGALNLKHRDPSDLTFGEYGNFNVTIYTPEEQDTKTLNRLRKPDPCADIVDEELWN